ncbi:MAG: c-type cytochrome domain-containing protein, partial [Planctomycetaceae bacterium]
MVRQALILPACGTPLFLNRTRRRGAPLAWPATRAGLRQVSPAWAICLLLSLFSLVSPLWAVDQPAGLTLYQSQVRPLLNSRCVACHGALKQSGGLRLDTATLTRQGGDSGPAIDLGEPRASLLLEKVALATAEDAAGRMPPEGEPLTSEQQSAILEWISQGAPAPAAEVPESDPARHWAFQPIVRPTIPTATGSLEVRNPIDAFLAAGQHR